MTDEQEARQIFVQRGVIFRNLVLSVMLKNAIYSGMHRNATTVVHMHDHVVEMELDAARRLTRVQVAGRG